MLSHGVDDPNFLKFRGGKALTRRQRLYLAEKDKRRKVRDLQSRLYYVHLYSALCICVVHVACSVPAVK